MEVNNMVERKQRRLNARKAARITTKDGRSSNILQYGVDDHLAEDARTIEASRTITRRLN